MKDSALPPIPREVEAALDYIHGLSDHPMIGNMVAHQLVYIQRTLREYIDELRKELALSRLGD